MRGGTLRFDVVAGVTAAAVVLPKAMAYATVAGLPVAVGLYTAFVPMAIYAFLGSSRVLSVSSSATLGILTGTELGLVVPDGDPAKLVTATATLVALVGVMLLLAPLLGFLPYAALAAIVIVYSAGLIQPKEFIAIRNVRAMEFYWAIVAALGVLILGTLQGIVVAIILSLIGLAAQTANPRVFVIGRKRGADVLRPLSPANPDDETFEGLLILRPEGRLFFLNAQSVAEQIRALIAQHDPRVLALDMSRVPDIEYSALQALMAAEERTTSSGAIVWLAGLNPRVMKVVRKSGFAEQLGPDRLLYNARAAIERFQTRSSSK